MNLREIRDRMVTALTGRRAAAVVACEGTCFAAADVAWEEDGRLAVYRVAVVRHGAATEAVAAVPGKGQD